MILRGPAHVNIAADRRVYAPGDSARVTFTTTDAEGRPTATRLNLRFTASRLGSSGETSTSAILTQELAVPATGTAEIAVPHLSPGYYELAAMAGPARLASSVVFVTDKGGDIPFTPDELSSFRTSRATRQATSRGCRLCPLRVRQRPGDAGIQ